MLSPADPSKPRYSQASSPSQATCHPSKICLHACSSLFMQTTALCKSAIQFTVILILFFQPPKVPFGTSRAEWTLHPFCCQLLSDCVSVCGSRLNKHFLLPALSLSWKTAGHYCAGFMAAPDKLCWLSNGNPFTVLKFTHASFTKEDRLGLGRDSSIARASDLNHGGSQRNFPTIVGAGRCCFTHYVWSWLSRWLFHFCKLNPSIQAESCSFNRAFRKMDSDMEIDSLFYLSFLKFWDKDVNKCITSMWSSEVWPALLFNETEYGHYFMKLECVSTYVCVYWVTT